jgi:hypothetical protein
MIHNFDNDNYLNMNNWINNNENNLNYIFNLFLNICNKYDINFSKKNYDSIYNDLIYYFYTNSN